MALRPLEFVLRAVGAQAVASAFRGTGTEARKAGDEIKGVGQEARKAGDDIKRSGDDSQRTGEKIERGGQRAASGFRGVGREARVLVGRIREIGREGGLDRAATAADRFQRKIEMARERTAALQKTLGGLRMAGVAMAAAGTGGILLSRKLQGMAEEDIGDTKQMEAMLQKRGYGDQIESMKKWVAKQTADADLPDDEPIKKATSQLLSFGMSPDRIKALMPGIVGQARLNSRRNGGTEVMDEIQDVAKRVGTGYSTGNAGQLRRSAITLSKSDLDYIKAGNTELEKQDRLFEKVKESLDKYALGMSDGLTDAAKSANALSRQMDTLTTNVGDGAQQAQMGINSIAISITKMANLSPEIEKAGGKWFTYGSYALGAAGSVLSIGAQAGMSLIALQAMGVDSAAVFAFMRVGALSTAASVGLIAVAALAAVAAIALAIYSWEINKDRILNPTSSTTDKRDYNQKQEDVHKALAIDRVSRSTDGLSKRDRYVVLQATGNAYAQLGGDDNADRANAAYGEARDLRKELGRRYTTATSPEAKKLLADLKALKAGANRSSQYDKGDFQGYKTDDGVASKAADIKKQIDALSQGASVPVGSPAAMGAAGGASVGKTSLDVAENDPYADQIRQLQRQKRDLKGKENAAARAALQTQIDGLQDKQREWKGAHAQSLKEKRAQESARKKASTAAARAETLAQRERDKQDASDNNDSEMLAKIDVAAKYEAQIGALEDQLDAARDEQNAAKVRALTLQIERAKAMQKYEEETLEASFEKNDAHKAALEAAAKKHFDNAVAASQRIANNAAGDVEKDLARDADRALKKGQKKGVKDGSDSEMSDDAIRAQMANLRSGGGSSIITSALGANINYGDRFAESDRLRPRYSGAPLHSFQSYNRTPEQKLDIGAFGVPEVAGGKRNLKARIKSMRQNAAGKVLVQFEEIAFPYMGLSEAGE